MKIKTELKLILFVVFIIALVGAGSYYLLLAQLNRENPINSLTDQSFGWKFPISKFPLTGSSRSLAYSSLRDPGGTPQGLPVRLKIPVIGVDSAIEDALITPDGRMDVTAGTVNVAWFSLGPYPGQIGSAVIGGHFGLKNEVPFVFYNLDKLKTGDRIYVIDDRGDTLTFVVRSISSFDRNADATSVFTSQDGLAHLNLITCEGIWNQVNNSFPDRLVIFTDKE
jgi:LPXTG-site transpeptidase (sortase) family protein